MPNANVCSYQNVVCFARTNSAVLFLLAVENVKLFKLALMGCLAACCG